MASTLADLELGARRLAGVVSSSLFKQDELRRWVNQSGRELHGHFVTKYVDHLTSPSPATFVLSGSQSTYAWPSIVMKPRRLEELRGGRWVKLGKSQFESHASLADGPRSFLVMGRSFVVLPENNAAGTYRYWIIPRWTDMTGSLDALPAALDDYADYVEVDVAIKCLGKRGMDAGALMQQKRTILERIEREAAIADAGDADSVGEHSDSYGDDCWWW